MKTFYEAAIERNTVVTSTKAAFIVGSLLALINYGDRIFLRGDMNTTDWIKIALTYCVPYCVATYGAARYATKQANDKGDTPAAKSS
jgi:hypothetical protein